MLNKILPGFTKDMKCNISNENVWTLLLFQLTLLHRHVYEFSFETQNVWEESINELRNLIYYRLQ